MMKTDQYYIPFYSEQQAQILPSSLACLACGWPRCDRRRPSSLRCRVRLLPRCEDDNDGQIYSRSKQQETVFGLLA